MDAPLRLAPQPPPDLQVPQTDALPLTASRKLILVGNPNVGKSLLFNSLTRRYAAVSNYPGTTVEITTASVSIHGTPREIIDTPGVASLVPHAEDERVTRDLIIQSRDADLLQVGDLKNIRRTLLLTLQIAEFELPFSLCLNMSDEAREEGIHVDHKLLSDAMGIDVVPTSALRRWNMDALRTAILRARKARVIFHYSESIEGAIQNIISLLPALPIGARGVATALLAGDTTILPWLEQHVSSGALRQIEQIRSTLQDSLEDPVGYLINRDRLLAVDRLLAEVLRRSRSVASSIREWLGAISMHPIWGVPILAIVLLIGWWFVASLGAGLLVDFVEGEIFVERVNPLAIGFFDTVTPFAHSHALDAGLVSPAYDAPASLGFARVNRFLHDLFVGPYGVITMGLTYAIAIVLPVVLTFFTFFALLEDSGYLPRLAVMLNRLFRVMGLNGKAVLPMILGLGCDTMATLTTRILETRKEAIIVTTLLALGIPCSAQLGVIAAMLGPLGIVATLVWGSVLIVTILVVGWLAARLVPGHRSDFLLEVPPIRTPRASNVALKVLARTEWYLREAVPLFVLGTLVLYVLDFTHALAAIQQGIAPVVVNLLGLPAEAATAFVLGFLRRDYGAAGLLMMQHQGRLDPIQTVVSLTVITLFIPCIANLFMIIKERGGRIATAVGLFIVAYAIAVGWALNLFLRAANLPLGG